MSPTGTNRKQVTKGRGETYEPSSSPDGKRIAFTDKYKPGTGKVALYVVGSAGGPPKAIVFAKTFLTDSAWSPSGKVIMFTRISTRLTVRPDGTGLKTIGACTSPSWSPDSKRVAFERRGDLWIMNANGTGAKRVIPVPNSVSGIAWSPDGNWIAYGGAERGDLRLIHPDGTAARQLTHQAGQFNSWPAWQPKP